MKISSLPTIYPVTCHTEHVGIGSVFFALQGAKTHGEQFIAQAIKRGATKIVIDKEYSGLLPDHVSLQQVKNGHEELAIQAAKALDFPAHTLKIIGITGTKGKTSSAMLLFHLLQNSGIKTALISTVENRIGNDFIEKSLMTTPTADFLQIFSAQAVKSGATHLIIEISAHALSYKKLTEIPLSMILFTNFGQDHLDFYKTMDQYFLAKLKIFSHLLPQGEIIINGDDQKASDIISHIKKNIVNYSLESIGLTNTNTIQYSIVDSSFKKSTIIIKKQAFSIPYFFGKHNCQNLAMTLMAAQKCGIANDQLQKALNSFSGIPGRLEPIQLDRQRIAFVDYAHNPSSMESVLTTLAAQTKQLIVIFGCGGDKDRLKRPLMGKIASKHGQIVIITNDNPRTEEPEQIIKEIMIGIETQKNSHILIIQDRKNAIASGLARLKPGGILAVLGKGHETEQIIGTTRYSFDDRIVIKELS